MTSISPKAVQHGLERKNTGKLQSLWVELPGHCNLACSYCYAGGGEKLNTEKLLKWEDYVSIIEQAKAMGADSIGIPGAGEPFVAKNKELTMKFLRKCAELGIYVTLFTTGELIDDSLADELYNLPVELMIKGNSLDPEKQDKFVSDLKRGREIHGYGERRNKALEMLMEKGFNNEAESMKKYGRKSRMALVTSIMTDEKGSLSNLDDMAKLLRRCRKDNIIFDVDSVLKRGRGKTCELSTDDQQLKGKLLELQKIDRKEFPDFPQWELSQSYVGTICDRYMHHMYINQYGDIRPCIGAMDVKLGNAKEASLEQAWQSPEMKIIRNREYIGKCGEECANFAEHKCNSCLGRRSNELTSISLRNKGKVETTGCWNFRSRCK